MRSDDRDMEKKRIFGFHYLMPALVLFLGAVATALLSWVYSINQKQMINHRHADVLMDMQIKIAAFHLWFHEVAQADGVLKEVMQLPADLDDSIRLSRALLQGGVSEHGASIPPLEDPAFREHAEIIESRLAKLQEIVLRHYEEPRTAEIIAAANDEVNAAFRDFMENARTLEVFAERSHDSEYTNARSLLFVAVLMWAAIVVTSAFWIYVGEQRRKRTELALERAQAELEQRVRERTSALTAAVAEKVNLQAEAMRTAHLASLGELSAGVAHEINNPVNGIINCAQILCDKSPASSTEHDLATRIIKEGNRIGDIVRGLLAFAREKKVEKRPVAVSEILSDALALTMSQMTKEGIELITDVPPDLPDVVANPQQIQQVFMNVISNARYALNMRYHGSHANKVLEIQGERIMSDGAPQVRIVFHDRGTGIALHVIDKVKEPFFSTKPSNKGTGLGLSISHGIVLDHSGRLEIESVEGEFTRIVIDLPAKENGDGAGSGN